MVSRIKRQRAYLLLSLVMASPASAQTGSAPAPVTVFNGGWANDAFSLSTSAPFVNPAHCTATDLYSIYSPSGGFKTLLATALSVTVSRQNVSIVVSNTTCSADNRPLIIGIGISP